MKEATLKYLENNQSATPSHWREEAENRRENRSWMRYSQRIAVILLSYMKQNGLTQAGLAERLGCTQQYVSKILKGSENLTIDTISKIEKIIGYSLFVFNKGDV